MFRSTANSIDRVTAASAVQRIVFLAGDAAALDMIRAQAEFAASRRHVALMVAAAAGTAEATPEFAADGITFTTLPEPAQLSRFFPERAFRKEAGRTFNDWRATLIVAEGTDMIALAGASGAAGAVVPMLLSELRRGAELAAALKPVAQAFAAAPAIFVADPDVKRTVTDVFGAAVGQRTYVLSPSSADAARVTAQPLPSLAHGLIFSVLGPLRRDRRDRLAAIVSDFSTVAGGDSARLVEASPAAGDLEAVFVGSHAVVVPEPVTSLSRGVVTALFCGRAIIAGDGVLARLMVDAGVNGWLVQGDSADAWRDALGSAVRHPDLLAAMGQASRIKAERRFEVQAANATFATALGLQDLTVARR